MDQQGTLTAAPVSAWNAGLSEKTKWRLTVGAIIAALMMTVAWMVLLALLAREIWIFMG